MLTKIYRVSIQMINVTKVISSAIDTALRFVKVRRLGNSDVQNVKEFMPFGIDGAPLPGMTALYLSTGVKGANYVVGYINKNQKALPGELRLFSLDADGKEKTYQIFKKDGTIEILGDADFMVRYSKLELAYNELQGKHNQTDANFVALATALNLLLGTTTFPPSTSTGDITLSKIKEIKTTRS